MELLTQLRMWLNEFILFYYEIVDKIYNFTYNGAKGVLESLRGPVRIPSPLLGRVFYLC